MQRSECRQKLLPKRQARCRTLRCLTGRELGGQSQARDEMYRQRARAKPALLPAAVHERGQGRPAAFPPPRDQRTDAFGRVDLVSADADEIHARIFQRPQVAPKRLCRIHVKENRMIRDSPAITSIG